MEKKYVLALSELGRYDHEIAGGKGANLGELSSKFAVPNGMVVSSHSFREFIVLNCMAEDIFQLENKPDNFIAQKLKGKILSGEFPQSMLEEIYVRMKNFYSDFVAVRSSAVFEDSGEASWAGQLETYTNVRKENVADAVKKCWASLFSDRAIAYYTAQKNKKGLGIAVVIQEMLEPETSGICFTANPITNNTNEIVIEAGFGLGEAIVSGQVTPDLYIVKKDTFEISKIVIAEQEKMLMRHEGKTKEIILPNEKCTSQKLDEEKIIQLARKATEIEAHYGRPQDIEWAYSGGKLYFLQARPITTLQSGFRKP